MDFDDDEFDEFDDEFDDYYGGEGDGRLGERGGPYSDEDPNENKTPYAGVPTSTDSGAWEFCHII